MKVLLIILFHILATVLGTPLWMDTFWEETTAAGVIAQVDTILLVYIVVLCRGCGVW